MLAHLSALCSGLYPRPSPHKRILVVNGHPDPSPARFSAGLCAAYTEGAKSCGHKTRHLEVGAAPWPGAQSNHPHWLQFEAAKMLEHLWLADRLFIAFPMWLGGPPPALTLILEELARWQHAEAKALGEKWEGKDAHVVVTASFPSFVYATDHGDVVAAWARSLSALRTSNIMVIGNMDLLSVDDRSTWLSKVRHLGASP